MWAIIWAYDFVEDALADGMPLRILTVMDEFTREGLAIDVARTTSAERVIGVLTALFAQHGAPAYLHSDNGAEFVAIAVQTWLAQCGVPTLYIDPGKPWQNGKEERFNGTVRDDCLNLHVFTCWPRPGFGSARSAITTIPSDHIVSSGTLPRWRSRQRGSKRKQNSRIPNCGT